MTLAWVLHGRLVAVIISLFSLPACAAAGNGPIAPAPLASALQMLLGLGLVLAAIAGTAWLLRRLAPGQTGSAGDLHVVAAVAVGPKERVVLVDVGETRLVLGVAQGQVALLHEMPRPADAALPGGPRLEVPFVEKLRELLAKRGTQNEA